MTSRFDLLPKDMLFKLVLELDYPDLISFCNNPRVNQLVCKQNDIWLAKLQEDFGDDYQMLKPNFQDNYELLYKLTELKRKLKLKEDIYTRYQSKYLNLAYNRIKEIPKEIGQLINLQNLYSDGNQIKEIPKEIGQLTNLETLDLRNNQIKEIPKQIGQLTSLNL